MYLQHFPTERIQKVSYILVWVLYFSTIEYIFEKKGLFVYENGWNAWWSTIFNIIAFSIIRLHYKNYLVAFLVSIPIVIVLLLLFHPALDQLK